LKKFNGYISNENLERINHANYGEDYSLLKYDFFAEFEN